MDTEALRLLAEHRAQSDTKQLKKAIKEFYALLRPDVTGDHLEANHATFNITLDNLDHHLAKSRRIRDVTQFEVDHYQAEQAAIEKSSRETRVRIEALSNRLVEAQQERARRIEYDALAKTIAKLPDREKGTESKQKLQSDIDLLRQEEQTYAETWRTRKLAFDAIVESLEAMQEAIRDEKAEQERRRALDEDDDPTSTEADPPSNLAAASAAVGSTSSTSTTTHGEPGQATGGGGAGPALDPNATPFVPGSREPAGDQEMMDADDVNAQGPREGGGGGGGGDDQGDLEMDQVDEKVKASDGRDEREEGEMETQ
ncbi:hypothetical protein JCM10212_000827 [Sporobolomyces blumeae]